MAGDGRLFGRPGVLGTGRGVVRRADELSRAPGHVELDEPIVLLTRVSNPELYVWVDRLAAVVAVNGSSLCHLANLLREVGVPYLYGVTELGSLPTDRRAKVVVGADSAYIELRPEEPMRA